MIILRRFGLLFCSLKDQASRLLSHDLYWENKMYKPKRSIGFVLSLQEVPDVKESRIQQMRGFGIRNPLYGISRIHKFRWNLRSILAEPERLESGIHESGSRIHESGSRIHESRSRIWNPPAGISNPRTTWIPLHRAKEMSKVAFSLPSLSCCQLLEHH